MNDRRRLQRCPRRLLMIATLATLIAAPTAPAAPPLLTRHCGKCHSGDQPEGDFLLSMLGERVTTENQKLWVQSFEFVQAGEMPPSEESPISDSQRHQVSEYFRQHLRSYQAATDQRSPPRVVPRRLNNREFARAIAQALLIEDAGTHQAIGNLIGDGLHDGFDTHGDTLGISEYHLEQYIETCRKIIDAVVLTGAQPESKRYVVAPQQLRMSSLAQRTTRGEVGMRRADSFEFTDPRLTMYFENFESVPATGWYRLKVRATGIDRDYYDAQQTGIYPGDPIPLQLRMGDRKINYDLPDEQVMEIETMQWLARGTRVQLAYPTDGLRLLGNGNFKFQNRIAHDHIQKHDPQLYQRVLREEVPRARTRADRPGHWVHWVKYWRGPRPRVFGAEVEGPLYQSWPPKRQVALLGANPDVKDAERILLPLAQRAWRRDVRPGELDGIVKLVQSQETALGPIEAFKEGMVAILVSPSFLLINPDQMPAEDRFANKLSFFFASSSPEPQLRSDIAAGKLASFDQISSWVGEQFREGNADEFLAEFPHAWLQLDRINFMAPDPDYFHHYHRKNVSEDMIAEVKTFFADAIDRNESIPKLLTADHSFINADLANIYGVSDVPQDSKLRRYDFQDGRRGGLLGMGAFLTLTADSLGTSPIHRAVYVLENFLGTKPAPPPGDIEIPEPDVRQAKTIKEILSAHVENQTCASCHQMIDPYGYAFENFDPAGGWRDQYVSRNDKTRLPIDAAGQFRDGSSYRDIIEFRQRMKSARNRERFVRCFIKKLLLYANGEEPDDFAELDRILAVSAKHEYRLQETIAAVVDSPLFRGAR